MKKVTYTNEEGFIKQVLLPEDDSGEDPEMGVPVGPPDFEHQDWLSLARDINNAMAENGIFTEEDLRKSGSGMQPAMLIFKRFIQNLYYGRI